MLDKKPGNDPHSQNENSSQDPLEDRLSRADFSRANPPARSRLRGRLLAEAAQDGKRRRAGRTLRLAGEIAGLGLLAVFFLFAVTRLLDHQSIIPGALMPSPTESSTPVRATWPEQAYPAPYSTPTPGPNPTGTKTPAVGYPAPGPSKTAFPGPTATPLPPPLIDLNSSPDAVRLAISSPQWNSLWLEAEIAIYPATGDTSQPDTRRYTQAWLKRSSRWLALTSPPVPADINFNLDVEARSISAFDGKTVTRYDKQSGETTTSTAVPETPAPGMLDSIFPPETTNTGLELVYPGFLWILSSEPQPLRMDFILDRWAVVADWGNSRLWVDSQTGILLKAERYTGKVGESPLSSVLTMRQIQINPQFDDTVFSPPYLNELTFKPAPGQTAAQPRPTPTPWASYSDKGWLYIQAANQAPFEWQVFSLPASCLFDAGPCTKSWQVPGNPNLQITGLYWSPDHALGVFSDTNNNQIVALDVNARRWLRVVKGFFQPQLTWSPDGSRFIALGEGVSAYDMSLVMVNPGDWSVKNVPTTLRGEKRVIGWLDNRTVFLQIMLQDNFKGGTPDWVATDFHPGFYRLDVETGQADPLMAVSVAQPLYDLTLTPDGRQLTYWKLDQNNVPWIYLASPDGSQTTKTGLQGHYPTWSPDGQWLLFQQTRPLDPNQPHMVQDLPHLTTLLLARPDGSGLQKVLESTATLETAWSPDSKYLLVSEFDASSPGAYAVSLYDVQAGTLKKIEMPGVTNSAVLNLLGWEP